jgi:hypothetical protein
MSTESWEAGAVLASCLLGFMAIIYAITFLFCVVKDENFMEKCVVVCNSMQYTYVSQRPTSDGADCECAPSTVVFQVQ